MDAFLHHPAGAAVRLYHFHGAKRHIVQSHLRPIERLTESARAVAAGDFTDKPPVYSADELGVLTKTFNDMSAALEFTLEEVESERDKLSTMFQHMTDGIVAFDREGNLLHINDAARGFRPCRQKSPPARTYRPSLTAWA